MIIGTKSIAQRTNVFYNDCMKLSLRQEQIIEFMAAYQQKEGFPPSVREICKALGLASPGSLLKHLRSLEEKGLLENMHPRKRAWKLTHRNIMKSIPLMGRIAAGSPIFVSENKEDDLPIDPKLFGSDEAFALLVKGDSMIEAHIRDGDIAVIKPRPTAEDGEVVAVMIEGMELEATLKIFRKKNGAVELHPANPAFRVQVFRQEEQNRVTILGKLIGIIRPKP
jgi:repressor LexA